MTSPPIRSVAADSNVLLSAVAGKAARRVFTVEELVVVTTDANLLEVEEYIPHFASLYRIPEEALRDVLAVLPVISYSEAEYSAKLAEARRLLALRDPDDVALGALALTLNVPIWSNDRDFDRFPTGVFTTATLLKALNL